MKYFIETLLFPPGLNLVIAIIALALWQRRRIALILLIGDMALLYLLSLPVAAWALMSALQPYPALKLQSLPKSGAQAIVVLGAGRHSNAPEYGGDTLSPFALERLRYAARLQRASHLPLMVAGGMTKEEAGRVPEAVIMKKAARKDFGVDVTWIETQSHTTAENAANAAVILRENGIHRIYLVTHAWHMPRAAWSFRHAGIEVIPAPTAFVTMRHDGHEHAWQPNARALYHTSLALHEMIGLIWYRIAIR